MSWICLGADGDFFSEDSLSDGIEWDFIENFMGFNGPLMGLYGIYWQLSRTFKHQIKYPSHEGKRKALVHWSLLYFGVCELTWF